MTTAIVTDRLLSRPQVIYPLWHSCYATRNGTCPFVFSWISSEAFVQQEEFQLGQFLRQRYLNESSPTFIQGINTTVVDSSQIRARADAGGEGGVIFNSALALLQGFFPPTSISSEKIANGTTITAPFGGYQYIPVESVEPENDISLEGWTSCNTFGKATKAFYASAEFREKEKDNAEFLSSLKNYLGGRAVSLEDMVNNPFDTLDLLTHSM